MREVLAESRAVVLTAHALALDVMTAKAVEALRRAGVRSIVLKGPSIARWLYAEGSPRPYADTDLLVSPAELESAGRALESIGYSLVIDDRISPMADPHHLEWRHGTDGARLDLHWRLAGIRSPPELAWQRFAAATETTQLAGTEVEFLGVPARVLHLALHARQDVVVRAKPLEDLRRGVRLLDEPCWRAAAELAAGLDATDAFAAGLRAIPEGAAMAADLALPAARLSTVVEMRAAGASLRSVHLQRLWCQRGPLGTARALLRVAVPPVAYMRFHSGEARVGRARLAAAYARRLVSLVGDIVPVLRSVVRANARPRE